VTVLAIDPGTAQSGWVLYDSLAHCVTGCAIEPNERIIRDLRNGWARSHEVAIECFQARGGANAIGQDSILTVLWTGRFMEAAGKPVELLYRSTVKVHVCGTARAKDPHVRQALIDLFPPTGGGRIPQVGVKAKRGPLYGMAGDMWAALGVAITYIGRHAGQGV